MSETRQRWSWRGSWRGSWLAWAWASVAAAGCAGDDGGADATSGTGTGAATRATTAADGAGTEAGPDADDGESTAMPATDDDAPMSTTDGDSGETDEPTGDTGVPSTCGNGAPDEGEGCDEANGVDADGCNEDCTVSGSILWSHVQTTGFAAHEDFNGIALDTEGNAYVAGSVQVGETGARDYWVRQYTADGALGWTVSAAGTAATNDAALDVAIAGDEVLIAGFLNQSAFSSNWQITSYALAGAQQWSASYSNIIGGADVAEAIAVDASGAAYVAGRSAVTDQGQNVLVRQYLPGGTAGWDATVAGVGDQRALAIAVDFEGNVIAGGNDFTVGQGRNGWIRKYSPAGATLWTHAYPGAAGLDDQVWGLATDGQGDIVAVGIEGVAEQGTIAFVRRLGPDGTEAWTQTWSGRSAEPVVALDVTVDGAGHIVMVGTETVDGIPLGLIRKYDADGSLRWSQTYATDAMTGQSIRAVTTGPDDRIWIAGGRDLGIDGRDGWIARIAQ